MKSGRLNTAAVWLALVAMAFLNWGPSWSARNGSGTMSIPNSFTPNTTISSADFNENFTDIATEITNSVAADGQTPITGPLKGANGSASLPGYAFNSDPDSGLYRIGADNIGLAVGGAKVVDVASTGITVTGSLDGTVVKQGTYRLIPAGTVMFYAGTAIPDGWLASYGQAVSRSTYSDMFTNLSTTYGAGNGTTTFNLPDCRGRVIAGKDDMGGSSANRLTNQTGGLNGDTLGATGGTETHTLTTAQMPSHTHTGTTSSDGAHTHGLSESGRDTGGSTAPTVTGAGNDDVTGSSGAHTHTFTTNSTGSGEAHNIVQPTIVMQCIIKI